MVLYAHARTLQLMGRTVDVENMVDAQEVADLIGLAQRNSVSLYQRRYPDMPRPVIDLGNGRCKLWLRTEVKDWIRAREEVDSIA